jgi:GT2 family glycosyltransferase
LKKTAVILTTYNRKSITLRCLDKLYELNKNFDVYLVDDASSDDTAIAVKAKFPTVNLIKGNGYLFWNRGMHLAWDVAKKNKYNYYMWLNDDVLLSHSFYEEFMECSELSKNNAIIVGIVKSHDEKEILYGGTDHKKKLLVPDGKMQLVTNMNGNVVLIPSAVFDKLGNLDPKYHHDLGDVDYGLRAKANGIKVLTTRVSVGSCDRNHICRVRLWNANIVMRYRKLYSPLGSHPLINFYFRKKHYSLANAIFYYAFLHLINMMPDKLTFILFGEKYAPKKN